MAILLGGVGDLMHAKTFNVRNLGDPRADLQTLVFGELFVNPNGVRQIRPLPRKSDMAIVPKKEANKSC